VCAAQLTETKKIERVYPNLLWAVNYGYARIVERLLARMVALNPSAKPTSVPDHQALVFGQPQTLPRLILHY